MLFASYDSSSSSPMSGATQPSNPFAVPAPIPTEVIRNIDILARVPIRLSQEESSYYAWKTHFHLVFCELQLQEHIDGTVDAATMAFDAEWLAVEATLIRWFFLTISPDLFQTVVHDGDDACVVWTKLNGLFTDNQL